jgi:protein gp37
MQRTAIGWTDFSANLLKYRNQNGEVVWACVHASEGCRFCYSEALAKRWGRGEAFTAENMKALTPFFDEKEAAQIIKSKKISGKKVFINDMTDLFGEWVSDAIIDQHFAVFAMRPDVTLQILTKRAKRMHDYFAAEWHRRVAALLAANRDVFAVADDYNTQFAQGRSFGSLTCGPHESRVLPNVHLGVSIEDQADADARLPWLLETPAAVRWASVEPMLGQVDLQNVVIAYFKNERIGADYIPTRSSRNTDATPMAVIDALTGDCKGRVEYDEPLTLTGQTIGKLDGIVIGGESGAGHREMPLTDALVLAEAARAAGIAVYFKQDSGPRPGMQGRIPDDVWAMKEWPRPD